MPIHLTLSNKEIEYELTPELAAFVDRVRTLAAAKRTTDADLVGLIYSKENPILDHSLFPERGAVTREVLDNPVYHVLCDLLARKRLELEGVDVEVLASRYTVTVSEAAEMLGIHPSAVRQAIDARRLASWKKDGKHFLNPDHFASFRLGNGGPKKRAEPTIGQTLVVRMGNVEGSSVRISALGSEVFGVRDVGHILRGDVAPSWTKVFVIATHTRGAQKTVRYFELAPSHEAAELKIGDEFYVRGGFRIVRKTNNATEANAAWRARPRDPSAET